MSPFDSPLGGLPPASWDRDFAQARFYSSSLWLSTCALPPGSTSGAVVVSGAFGRAAMPVAHIVHEPNAFTRWSDQLSFRGLPSPAPHGLLVGQRRGYQAELLLSPDPSDPPGPSGPSGPSGPFGGTAGSAPSGPRAGGAASALLAELRALGKELGGACVAMYLTTPAVTAFHAAGVEAVPVLLETDAWIPVPAGGWQEWVDSVARRRGERLREARLFAAAGYQLTLSTLEKSSELVGRLLGQTQQRHGADVDIPAYIESFRRQGELAGDACEVLIVSLAGEPIGFCMFFRYGDTLHVRATGLDYDHLAGGAEYFNLGFHLPVRLAAESGHRWVHCGISTPEAKALRGAQLRPLWLLDLAEDTPLLRAADDIRAHNRRTHAHLRTSSRAVAEALVPELWLD